MWIVFILLSVLGFAGSNVLDSVLVHHYEKHPVVLMWAQSFFGLLALCTLAVVIRVSYHPWALPLFLFGCIVYLGDLLYFRALDLTDVSVSNIAWVFLSVLLTVLGVLFLGDTWSLWQGVGILLVLLGVAYLSLAHQHVTLPVLLILTTIAFLYVPYYLYQKVALLRGYGVLTVAFWGMFGRECTAFLSPWLFPGFRRKIRSLPQRVDGIFFSLCAVIIICFMFGVYFGILAYQQGMLSLVSIAANVQPFFVMALAWLLWRFRPTRSSRELFTWQTVRVKLLSFVVVFVGLGFLATS
ncbi:MAG: EamA family transporter [Candidatus Peribacteraceae bacterium]|nr:EamA family transporter [Candidatus Peribacteraceae bacterium]